MKALSTTMTVIVTIIVILIAALVILTVFSGGIDKVSEQFNKWFKWITAQPTPTLPGGVGTASEEACNAKCTLWCKERQDQDITVSSAPWAVISPECVNIPGECTC